MIQCDIYNASYIYNDVLTFTTMQNDIYSDVVIVTVACGYLQWCSDSHSSVWIFTTMRWHNPAYKTTSTAETRSTLSMRCDSSIGSAESSWGAPCWGRPPAIVTVLVETDTEPDVWGSPCRDVLVYTESFCVISQQGAAVNFSFLFNSMSW